MVILNRYHVVAVNFLSADMVEPAKESWTPGSVFGMFDSDKIHIDKLRELNWMQLLTLHVQLGNMG